MSPDPPSSSPKPPHVIIGPLVIPPPPPVRPSSGSPAKARAASARSSPARAESASSQTSAAIKNLKAKASTTAQGRIAYMRRFPNNSTGPKSAAVRTDREPGGVGWSGSAWTAEREVAKMGVASFGNTVAGSPSLPDRSVGSAGSMHRREQFMTAAFGSRPGSAIAGGDGGPTQSGAGTLPRAAALPSHSAPYAQTHPVGAHTSGFYAMTHLTAAKSARISTMLHQRGWTSAGRHQRAHTVDGTMPFRERSISRDRPRTQISNLSDQEAAEEADGFASVSPRPKRDFRTTDYTAVENHLSVITDIDLPYLQILDALDGLLELAEVSSE
ncbi:hypothetical protein BDK51DRAFT_50150 [Blyttiomyces helicus]|uniref:Uncharacterized protein n=1 Tax=Blyttiomyces helicus TaxID=388810 RepID=A0A4P9W8P2_9FUNG|nr:hypothetical protein BDK51DRAFT_50150 [Blyttiomyces helicus]|eukprot:RKO87448.1 hypothetical protein BDK51DRAFT_50150 [Blyttiomyces helicus]